MNDEPLENVHHNPNLFIELSDPLTYHLNIDTICKKFQVYWDFQSGSDKKGIPQSSSSETGEGYS